MTTIRTIDINKISAISSRDVSVSKTQYGIDISQVDGSYIIVEPYGENGGYNGRIAVYNQDKTISYLNTFNRVGSLYYPTDAKIDYIRSKMWIADTGNNRVLKIDTKTNNADINIDENLYYPHAIVVDMNNGNIFIKGYSGNDLNYGKISYYRGNGVLLGEFIYNHAEIDSSTSSNSSDLSTQSSESIVIPSLPSNRSMCFDSVRSKLWWVDGNMVYVLDVRNKQIQSLDVSVVACNGAIALDVEYKTGNIYVVANCDISAVLEINKENNSIVGVAYLDEASSSSSSSTSSSTEIKTSSSSSSSKSSDSSSSKSSDSSSSKSSDSSSSKSESSSSSSTGDGFLWSFNSVPSTNNLKCMLEEYVDPSANLLEGRYNGFDGFMLVGEDNGYIWRTTDYGNNWTICYSAGTGKWSQIVSDSETLSVRNQYIYAIKEYTYGSPTYIYVSADLGVTWTTLTQSYFGLKNWRSICVSRKNGQEGIFATYTDDGDAESHLVWGNYVGTGGETGVLKYGATNIYPYYMKCGFDGLVLKNNNTLYKHNPFETGFLCRVRLNLPSSGRFCLFGSAHIDYPLRYGVVLSDSSILTYGINYYPLASLNENSPCDNDLNTGYGLSTFVPSLIDSYPTSGIVDGHILTIVCISGGYIRMSRPIYSNSGSMPEASYTTEYGAGNHTWSDVLLYGSGDNIQIAAIYEKTFVLGEYQTT